jgi:glycosyltransferase involved in cell wall biosynthesis
VVGGNSDDADERATPEIARLRSVARDEGVGEFVTFVGRRDRPLLHLYYQAADVFVTTPWYEPFGITPVEAMACARPVVGAAVGGIRTTVIDGVTGCLVPPRDPAAVADKLEYLLHHPTIAAAMGMAGRKRAFSAFTWQGVARSLAGIYREIVSESQAAEPASRRIRLAASATTR